MKLTPWLLCLAACSGDPFQPGVGDPSTDPFATLDATSDSPTATFSNDGGWSDSFPLPAPWRDADAAPTPSSDASGDALFEDAETPPREASVCPPEGCLCVQAMPPACPAGFPYVPHGSRECCNTPQ